MSDNRFKYHLGNVDSNTRTCLKFLYNMILDLKTRKLGVHPDVQRGLLQHDKDIEELCKQGNKLVEIIDALEGAYKDIFNMPKRLVDAVYEEVDKRKKEHLEEMEKINKQLYYKIDELEELRDYFEKLLDKIEKEKIFKKLEKFGLDPWSLRS